MCMCVRHAPAAAFIGFATRRASPACEPLHSSAPPGIEGDGSPRLARSEIARTGGLGKTKKTKSFQEPIQDHNKNHGKTKKTENIHGLGKNGSLECVFGSSLAPPRF